MPENTRRLLFLIWLNLAKKKINEIFSSRLKFETAFVLSRSDQSLASVSDFYSVVRRHKRSPGRRTNTGHHREASDLISTKKKRPPKGGPTNQIPLTIKPYPMKIQI